MKINKNYQLHPFDYALKTLLSSFPRMDEPWTCSMVHSPEDPRSSRVQIREEDGFLILHFTVPGWSKSDLALTCSKQVISLKGERKKDSAKEAFAEDNFAAAFKISSDWKVDKAEARLMDGILTVKIPKHSVTKERIIKIV